ncbi:DUF2946 domain-containing protein [Ramlibacter sp. 2FC]|uniref:DUF2946 domain-containing protein n=1 Tax=Ramlibacter sp. 2FC TaxID=2502188 RepID=UPI0010F58BA9|nr:DUF2946 domain-containing protein [Ramlibacter sp. 2FC]
MQTLRSARLLARLVLVWFALALGAAIASPLVQPQSLELVCSGAGSMKLVLKPGDGEAPASALTLDCPLCANLGAPPPLARGGAEPAQPLAHVLQAIPAAHIAWLTAAPLPARGPPLL